MRVNNTVRSLRYRRFDLLCVLTGPVAFQSRDQDSARAQSHTHTSTAGNQLWLTKLLTNVICAEKKLLASWTKTCKVETWGVITSSNYTQFLRIKIKFAISITYSSAVTETPLNVGRDYIRLHCGELNCEMLNSNETIYFIVHQKYFTSVSSTNLTVFERKQLQLSNKLSRYID
jgi:hypothetical protein